MTTLTKLICGVHTTYASVTLRVAGTPGSPAPPLIVVGNGAPAPITVPYDPVNQRWQFALVPGDYVIKIEVPSGNWWWSAVDLSVVDQPNVTLVFHGPETSPVNTHQTIAWKTSTARAGDDPKDPWPPPVLSNVVTLGSTSQTWFDGVLHAAKTSQLTPKAG
jgi:hypothetical protein